MAEYPIRGRKGGGGGGSRMNQSPRGIKWSAVLSPCSTVSSYFFGLFNGSGAVAPVGDKVL